MSRAVPPEDELYPGYALPPGSYAAPELRRPRLGRLIGRLGLAVAVVAAALALLSVRVADRPMHYMCPPDCGRPPTGMPVMALPRYTAPDGAFSVAYPAPGSAYDIVTGADGVTAKFTGGDTGMLRLFAQRAKGRSAREIAGQLIKERFPDARIAYEIPNAMVGYQPGYGEVADFWPQGTGNSYMRMRIVVLVAVKNDVALVAGATGPYHEFGPDFGPGPPSGANLQIAQDMGKYVNSFAWIGDPPR